MIAVVGGEGQYEIGTSFLNSFYAEFDYAVNTVSLAVSSRNPWTAIIRNASDVHT
jgi:hypothetical protein